MTLPTLTTSPGVLTHAGRSHLVHYLHAEGARVGHLRQLGDDGRWRWVIGDCVGDEATRGMALAVAARFISTTRAGKTSHRSVGPSSRRPGAGPVEGAVRVPRRPALAAPAWHPELVPGSPDWYRAGCPVPAGADPAPHGGADR